MQSIQCGSSSFLLKYFSILFCLIFFWCLSFQARLPATQFLMGGHILGLHSISWVGIAPPDNVSCSSWLDLFCGPLIYLPSLLLIFPRAIWHPQPQPTAQYLYLGPSSLQLVYQSSMNAYFKRVLNFMENGSDMFDHCYNLLYL